MTLAWWLYHTRKQFFNHQRRVICENLYSNVVDYKIKQLIHGTQLLHIFT